MRVISDLAAVLSIVVPGGKRSPAHDSSPKRNGAMNGVQRKQRDEVARLRSTYGIRVSQDGAREVPAADTDYEYAYPLAAYHGGVRAVNEVRRARDTLAGHEANSKDSPGAKRSAKRGPSTAAKSRRQSGD